MVRSGIVKEVSQFSKSGIIEDSSGKEFYFHVGECVENQLPTLWSEVTFIKDADYKSTNVACLIKRIKKMVG